MLRVCEHVTKVWQALVVAVHVPCSHNKPVHQTRGECWLMIGSCNLSSRVIAPCKHFAHGGEHHGEALTGCNRNDAMVAQRFPVAAVGLKQCRTLNMWGILADVTELILSVDAPTIHLALVRQCQCVSSATRQTNDATTAKVITRCTHWSLERVYCSNSNHCCPEHQM